MVTYHYYDNPAPIAIGDYNTVDRTVDSIPQSVDKAVDRTRRYA